MINRVFFFQEVKLRLFDGKITQKQMDGLTAILDEWDGNHANWDDRWLAYALGTAHHETGRTMQPIHEWGKKQYFIDMYDPPPTGKRPKVATQLGNTQAGDGPLFCGRGYVQLTGRTNYTKWKAKLGVDLVGDPDLAMGAAVAVKILFEGMQSGAFTGKKFADYFSKTADDWKNARRIINRVDKADLIASYGHRYYAAISHTT
jgi:hypothetical protein